MKNTIVKDHEKYTKDSDRAKFHGLLVYNALKNLGHPESLSEPSVNVSVWNPTVVGVHLYSWPIEASCCFVGEIEELLNAEAVAKADHSYGDKANVTYKLGTEDLTITVFNASASGCKLKFRDVEVRTVVTDGKEFDGVEC